MTARQPQTPQEAARLDPLGLMSFPAPARSGLFGGLGRRRSPVMRGGAPGYMAEGQDAPPIAAAPSPRNDWAQILGPELLGQLPQADPYADQGIGAGSGVSGPPATIQPLQGEVLPPSPPMRANLPALSSRTGNRGMFGGAASAGLPQTVGQPAMPPTIGGQAMAPGAPTERKKGGFDWRMAAGILGDALLGLNGQAAIYGPAMWKLRQQREEHGQRLSEMQEQNRLKMLQPDYATVGNRRYAYTPGTGESQVLYTAPTEAHDYAVSLGAQEGSEYYDTLVQDYVLKSSGPTATENDMAQEDQRQENRIGLEGVRQDNRIGYEGVRQGNRERLRGLPTYRQANPLPGKGGGERGGKGGGGSSAPSSPATNMLVTALRAAGRRVAVNGDQIMVHNGTRWVKHGGK